MSGLQANWTYDAEALSPHCYLRYWRRLIGARPAPRWLELKPVTPSPRWVSYFVFAPDGRLGPHHDFALRALHDMGLKVLVIVATNHPDMVPRELSDRCAALYWKALEGYDFSAYAIALDRVATASSGADVLILNDSVFGPFSDLGPAFDNARWELTGFTATDMSEQQHVQSYAFIIKDVTPARLASLRWVLPSSFAFNSAYGAISCQELWLARVASKSMSVGAFWYGSRDTVGDPSLERAETLLENGFPFLKRSLLGKHSRFQRQENVVKWLRHFRHPV